MYDRAVRAIFERRLAAKRRRELLSRTTGAAQDWTGAGREPVSGVQVLGQQQVVVRPGEVPDQLLERVERHLTEAAVERDGRVLVGGAGPGRYDVPVHGAQVLEQVRLLLEHGHAQAARERLLARVHAQVRLQVPAHAELLAAVRALVLAAGGARGQRRLLVRVRRRRRRRRRLVLRLFRRQFRDRHRQRGFHVCGQTEKKKKNYALGRLFENRLRATAVSNT